MMRGYERTFENTRLSEQCIKKETYSEENNTIKNMFVNTSAEDDRNPHINEKDNIDNHERSFVNHQGNVHNSQLIDIIKLHQQLVQQDIIIHTCPPV